MPRRDLRAQIDGRGFPDHVLALTWDDGPDAGTRALAEYLRRERVSGTFFVVGAWVPGVSSDPGAGAGVFATGADFVPVLGDLVRLGHRLGNHTENHALLWGASDAVVRAQLEANQRRLDPFLESEVALFRAPGGAWNPSVADVAGQDPDLDGLVGPVRWDVDRKDWEASLDCVSPRPQRDCEGAGPGGHLRVRPQVVAARYLDSIESARRGIVLLHDRVGHVGSRFALEVAQALVPQLRARGYVFAAPILHFSPLLARFPQAEADRAALELGRLDAFALGDVDGDGRADLCARDAGEIVCARSERGMADTRGRPEARFGPLSVVASSAHGELHLADVDGDLRADACTRGPGGEIVCALASRGEVRTDALVGKGPVRFADLDGDGRADACASSPRGLSCARSRGHGFEAARPWVVADPAWSKAVILADVDGDGRADACGPSAAGIACATSSGASFGHLRVWAATGDVASVGELLLGDLNGDGRADVCTVAAGAVACALSTGRGFTAATTWAPAVDLPELAAAGALRLADVNGDGRADLCAPSRAGVRCGMSP